MKPVLLTALLLLARLTFAQDERYVIMVSFDGFRYDHAEQYDLPNFRNLIREGASAEYMIPSYPSKTFPNHYTLVTGLYPGHHGLVDNSFYDKEKKVYYRTNNRDVVEDAHFYGGLPLWQLVQEHGMRSASYFWVGSEAPVAGRYPDIFKYYDHDFPNDQRIDSVFHWLSLPQEERPNLVTLYFSIVDSRSHEFGPNSPETHETLLEADRLLGRIMDGIDNSGLDIQLVVVSDHGMYEMRNEPETYIEIGELISFPKDAVKLSNNETHIHIYLNDPEDGDWIYDTLKQKEGKYRIYRRAELPEQWHYNNERVGDLLLVAEAGHAFRKASRRDTYGSHGFDPYTIREMGAIFYARGSQVRQGYRLPVFENVHVYAFICRLLGIDPPSNDGDVRVLESALRD